MYDKLIFELSKPGRKGYSFPKSEIKDYPFLGEEYLRAEEPELPEVT
jgi:glycine dehydrogenase subunit 2